MLALILCIHLNCVDTFLLVISTDVSAAVTGLVPSTSEGPPPLPGQCFQSLSLPVDAHVSDKLRGKKSEG